MFDFWKVRNIYEISWVLALKLDINLLLYDKLKLGILLKKMPRSWNFAQQNRDILKKILWLKKTNLEKKKGKNIPPSKIGHQKLTKFFIKWKFPLKKKWKKNKKKKLRKKKQFTSTKLHEATQQRHRKHFSNTGGRRGLSDSSWKSSPKDFRFAQGITTPPANSTQTDLSWFEFSKRKKRIQNQSWKRLNFSSRWMMSKANERSCLWPLFL